MKNHWIQKSIEKNKISHVEINDVFWGKLQKDEFGIFLTLPYYAVKNTLKVEVGISIIIWPSGEGNKFYLNYPELEDTIKYGEYYKAKYSVLRNDHINQ